VVPQPWNGQTGKVWVPDGVSGKLPLVVYLHGISRDDPKLWGAGRMIADDTTLKKDNNSMNLGLLAGKLIDDGKIKPIVVAAPSDRLQDLNNGTLWSTLDLGAFVDDVYSKSVNDALAEGGNTTTIVYSVHKGTGGWYDYDGDQPYADGFGVTRNLKGQTLPSSAEDDDKGAFDFYVDNGDKVDPPTRTVAKVALGGKGIGLHWSEILKAKASADPRIDHNKMPLVWSWYGLQRYFPK
jgi:hypothetical protein